MNKEIERLANNLVNFDPKDWIKEITKEDLQKDYERFKDIPDTLQINEMRLVWYLRKLRRGEIRRFMNLARQNYEVAQATDELATPINRKK